MSAAPYITVRERVAETKKTAPRGQRVRKAESVRVVARPAKKKSHSKSVSTFGLSTIEFAMAQAVTFVVLAVATFMMSVLLGNTMGEFERRKAVDAATKVKVAEADMVRLREQYDRLNSASDIGDWAIARGFTPAYGLGASEGYVAAD
jgi:hypothetical protein